ncbi:hypothetical protein BDV3_003114 [Batrachochytrium dendrobatidis]
MSFLQAQLSSEQLVIQEPHHNLMPSTELLATSIHQSTLSNAALCTAESVDATIDMNDSGYQGSPLRAAIKMRDLSITPATVTIDKEIYAAAEAAAMLASLGHIASPHKQSASKIFEADYCSASLHLNPSKPQQQDWMVAAAKESSAITSYSVTATTPSTQAVDSLALLHRTASTNSINLKHSNSVVSDLAKQHSPHLLDYEQGLMQSRAMVERTNQALPLFGQAESDTSNSTHAVTKKLSGLADKQQSQPITYVCTFPACNRIFYKPYNLKSHTLVHTGVRNHECSICQAAFVRRHDLLRHSRILHRNIRPESNDRQEMDKMCDAAVMDSSNSLNISQASNIDNTIVDNLDQSVNKSSETLKEGPDLGTRGKRKSTTLSKRIRNKCTKTNAAKDDQIQLNVELLGLHPAATVQMPAALSINTKTKMSDKIEELEAMQADTLVVQSSQSPHLTASNVVDRYPHKRQPQTPWYSSTDKYTLDASQQQRSVHGDAEAFYSIPAESQHIPLVQDSFPLKDSLRISSIVDHVLDGDTKQYLLSQSPPQAQFERDPKHPEQLYLLANSAFRGVNCVNQHDSCSLASQSNASVMEHSHGYKKIEHTTHGSRDLCQDRSEHQKLCFRQQEYTNYNALENNPENHFIRDDSSKDSMIHSTGPSSNKIESQENHVISLTSNSANQSKWNDPIDSHNAQPTQHLEWEQRCNVDAFQSDYPVICSQSYGCQLNVPKPHNLVMQSICREQSRSLQALSQVKHWQSCFQKREFSHQNGLHHQKLQKANQQTQKALLDYHHRSNSFSPYNLQWEYPQLEHQQKFHEQQTQHCQIELSLNSDQAPATVALVTCKQTLLPTLITQQQNQQFIYAGSPPQHKIDDNNLVCDNPSVPNAQKQHTSIVDTHSIAPTKAFQHIQSRELVKTRVQSISPLHISLPNPKTTPFNALKTGLVRRAEPQSPPRFTNDSKSISCVPILRLTLPFTANLDTLASTEIGNTFPDCTDTLSYFPKAFKVSLDTAYPAKTPEIMSTTAEMSTPLAVANGYTELQLRSSLPSISSLLLPFTESDQTQQPMQPPIKPSTLLPITHRDLSTTRHHHTSEPALNIIAANTIFPPSIPSPQLVAASNSDNVFVSEPNQSSFIPSSPNSYICLRNWFLRKQDVDPMRADAYGGASIWVALAGYLANSTDTAQKDSLWTTSHIVSCIDESRVCTFNGEVYRIIGEMDIQQTLAQGFPLHICEAFKNGFPQNWQSLLTSLVKTNEMQISTQDQSSRPASLTIGATDMNQSDHSTRRQSSSSISAAHKSSKSENGNLHQAIEKSSTQPPLAHFHSQTQSDNISMTHMSTIIPPTVILSNAPDSTLQELSVSNIIHTGEPQPHSSQFLDVKPIQIPAGSSRNENEITCARSWSKSSNDSNMAVAAKRSTKGTSRHRTTPGTITTSTGSSQSATTGPFRCQHEGCGKVFNRVYKLKSHQAVHEGKQYSCPFCSLPFARRHDLYRHARSIHSQNRKFHCRDCFSGYEKYEQYLRHLTLSKHDRRPITDEIRHKFELETRRIELMKRLRNFDDEDVLAMSALRVHSSQSLPTSPITLQSDAHTYINSRVGLNTSLPEHQQYYHSAVQSPVSSDVTNASGINSHLSVDDTGGPSSKHMVAGLPYTSTTMSLGSPPSTNMPWSPVIRPQKMLQSPRTPAGMFLPPIRGYSQSSSGGGHDELCLSPHPLSTYSGNGSMHSYTDAAELQQSFPNVHTDTYENWSVQIGVKSDGLDPSATHCLRPWMLICGHVHDAFTGKWVWKTSAVVVARHTSTLVQTSDRIVCKLGKPNLHSLRDNLGSDLFDYGIPMNWIEVISARTNVLSTAHPEIEEDEMGTKRCRATSGVDETFCGTPKSTRV